MKIYYEIAMWFIIDLVVSAIVVPLQSFHPSIYGCPDAGQIPFVGDYVFSSWQASIRSIFGQSGMAMSESPDPQVAQTYSLPFAGIYGTPTNIYQLLNYVKANQALIGSQVLEYFTVNALPSKTTQLDLFVVPEQIYVSFVWDGVSLKMFDGWIADQGCREYIVATATSQSLMSLFQNSGDMRAVRNALLGFESDGNMVFKFERLNPTTSAVVVALESFFIILIIASVSLMLYSFKRRIG